MPRLNKKQQEAADRAEDDATYGITAMGELAAYKRMVELYQAGAVIEYHDITEKLRDKRFHVGFRYDCMSDDDYFELMALERHFGVEENSNWRGDTRQRTRMAG